MAYIIRIEFNNENFKSNLYSTKTLVSAEQRTNLKVAYSILRISIRARADDSANRDNMVELN